MTSVRTASQNCFITQTDAGGNLLLSIFWYLKQLMKQIMTFFLIKPKNWNQGYKKDFHFKVFPFFSVESFKKN